jgi:HlyD family secretion protein
MKKNWFVIILLCTILTLSSCDGLSTTEQTNGSLRGSGQISAREYSVASELGSKVISIEVEEGSQVQVGDLLFRLDDEIYRAQYDQATAAVGLAEAGIETARAQQEAAKLNYQLALQGARFQEQPFRTASWLIPEPEAFDLPPWYFAKSEAILAVEREVEASLEALGTKQANLDAELQDASNADLLAVETRLAVAQTAYLIAQQTYSQTLATEGDTLIDIAQDQLDTAQAELENAQREYDAMLSEQSAGDILDARGQVAIAQASYDNALDRLDQLRTGDQSLQVEVASSGVAQADAGVVQAEAALAQAQAAVKVLEVQLAKTAIYAPAAGVVLARNLEVGEMAAPGATVFTIAHLDEVELTVYIPEDHYGQVKLDQEVVVTVDSFPNETFEGTIIRIADEAEFTPRNVQTVDGRKSTVYAVVILLPNPDGKLKPGMPADAVMGVGG